MADCLFVGNDLGLEHPPEAVKLLEALDLIAIDLRHGRELRVQVKL